MLSAYKCGEKQLSSINDIRLAVNINNGGPALNLEAHHTSDGLLIIWANVFDQADTTETNGKQCHGFRKLLADAEAESHGRPSRMLLIVPGGPAQLNYHELPQLPRCRMSDNTRMTAVSVECPGRKLDCSGGSRSADVKYSPSSSFDSTDRFEIGRYEQTSVMSSLGFCTIGVRSASLKPAGKNPATSDRLKSTMIKGATTSMICLRIDVSIESAAKKVSSGRRTALMTSTRRAAAFWTNRRRLKSPPWCHSTTHYSNLVGCRWMHVTSNVTSHDFRYSVMYAD